MLQLIALLLGTPFIAALICGVVATKTRSEQQVNVWLVAFALGSVIGIFAAIFAGHLEDQEFARGHDGRIPKISSEAVLLYTSFIASPISAAVGATIIWFFSGRKP